MNTRKALGLAAVALALCAYVSVAQHSGGQMNRGMGEPQTSATADSAVEKMRIEAELARNAERQKSLEQDTQELLKLANELNVAVGKSNQNTLSLDVIRKAEEIEKLAKHVKEKMKGQ